MYLQNCASKVAPMILAVRPSIGQVGCMSAAKMIPENQVPKALPSVRALSIRIPCPIKEVSWGTIKRLYH
jgi:hypothetical protein